MSTIGSFEITPLVKREIVRIIDERIEERHISPLREDFSELKGIVQNLGINVGELAIAQKETQKDVSRLDKTMQELAEAQKRTEARVEELAEAQKRTEARVEELAEAQKRTEIELQKMTKGIEGLTKGLGDTRTQLGGLEKSVAYSLENEAFRMLPNLLRERYGIEIKERLIRKWIGKEEINILGKAKMNGKDVFVVGETQLRLDEKRKKDKEKIWSDLERKVEIARKEYKKEDIVKILITHLATPGFIKEAEKRGVIIIQSFEW